MISQNEHFVDEFPQDAFSVLDGREEVEEFDIAHTEERAPISNIGSPDGRTDVANARRFVQIHGKNVLYWYHRKQWMNWCGTHWKMDDSGAVIRLGKHISDVVWRLAQHLDDNDARKFATKTASRYGIESMLSLAESEVTVAAGDLDQNEWLLNCPNGTIDLRTGKMHRHDKKQLITKICPTTPGDYCPTWKQFLDDIFGGNTELISFVQRLMGYSLTGSVMEHKLPIFHGDGSNGKSTLIGAIQHALGDDYFGTLPQVVLTGGGNNRHPTELTTLYGKRLTVAAETESEGRLNEALIKTLTGGDTISARGLYENYWTFNPTHKIILMTNHKPQVRGTDHAIWRRLLLVPFNVKFSEEQKDKEMPDKLKAESPGILQWMINGCIEWQRIGLQPPNIVLEATQQYRNAEDIIGQFIDACCLIGPGHKVRGGQLQDALKAWCDDSAFDSPGNNKLRLELDERGFKKTKPGNKTWYAGIGLKNDDEGLGG